MAVSRGRNAAFTLVELLVVITILGILMSLLLPAVNAVRESMRRAQCKNHLHQIGVAVGEHLSKYDYFPSAGWGMMWAGDADRGSGGPQPGSWIYQLLPFMGLDMIHDIGKGLGPGLPNDAKYMAAQNLRSTAIPNFICPTRRKVMMYPDGIQQGSFNAYPPPGTTGPGLNHSDYCGNTGTWNAGDAFSGPATTCLNTFPKCSWDADASNGDGVVWQASQLPPGRVTDGLGNTFFAGEKSLDPEFYYTSTQAGDDNSMMDGFDHDIIRWCGVSHPPVKDSLTEVCSGVHCPNDNSFGSAHSAGVQFVFCDGRVQLISYQVDLTVYTNLGCRNDGNVSENY